MKLTFIIPIIAGIFLSLPGCQTAGEVDPLKFLKKRDVKVTSSANFVRQLSDCVMVLPVEAKGKLEPYQDALEASLTRNVSQKFYRVISASDVKKLAYTNMLVLKFKKDIQTLRKKMNCDTVVTARLVGPVERNFVGWSGHEVGIEITIPAAHSLKHLWQGRHITSRSSGGIPLSPLGAAVEIAEAQMMALDDDVVVSVISDGVRRILSYFPKVS